MVDNGWDPRGALVERVAQEWWPKDRPPRAAIVCKLALVCSLKNKTKWNKI